MPAMGGNGDDPGLAAVALYSFASDLPEVLRVDAGDELLLFPSVGNKHWVYVMRLADGCVGYLPPSHVRLRRSVPDDQGGKLNALDDERSDQSSDDKWQDDEFFGSYGSVSLHREMLGDVARTTAYQRALTGSGKALQGKCVMDVGSGSSILALFAAKAGAAKVFAIEASTMAYYARRIISSNGYDGVIQVVEGRVEDDIPALPPAGSVDLIVSEWMGTFLIFENVIESVLVARDRFLKPKGKMFPSRSQLFLAPVDATALYNERIGFWTSVYGFDMSPLADEARRIFTSKPLHDYVCKPADLLAPALRVLDWDMHTLSVEQLKSNTLPFRFSIERYGVLHGIGSWFDVVFEALTPGGAPVVLSTGPDSPLTHWKQDLLLFDAPVDVREGDELIGTLVIRQNPVWRRHYLLDLTVRLADGRFELSKTYLMWR